MGFRITTWNAEQLGNSSFLLNSDTEDRDGNYQSSDSKIDTATLDSEGRCVILEFPAFVLIGVYCPAYRNESRDNFRMVFLNALDARVRNLVSMGKRVLVTGDINIAKTPLDSAHALEDIRKNVTTEEEYISGPSRRLFNALLSDGVVIGEREQGREHPVLHDICRSFHNDRAGMYTCWDTRLNTRPGNYGARIDYVLCSLNMLDWFSESNIQEGLMGSDHCPVYAIIKDQVPHGGSTVHIRDLMNPRGMFQDGERQQEYSSQYILRESGRLLPEFDVQKRRSIKDMFARKPSSTLLLSKATQSVVENSTTAPPPEGATSSPVTPSGSHPLPADENPKSLSRKRPQPPQLTSVKRSRSAVSVSKAAAPGQRTLKGFFGPKSADSMPSNSPETSSRANTPTRHEPAASLKESGTVLDAKVTASISPSLETVADAPFIKSGDSSSQLSSSKSNADLVIDPVASKEDWSKLFTKMSVPLCDGHQEPCISLTTKKPGMNLGRAFWICPRPLGPSGEKEKGTQWRCPTFIWASNWNKSSQVEL
ncbi:Endonuclease/exonuclease/phosphatase [Penicillium hispanicum]|uniref:Endonuclease/exonuclease/phosphatase n=1 Tax=Penicillium hispanicum TaxID=1080232 RepID=UPI0025412C51|nr:Endonuclease/exonuclease/phosphatase [Penicillium hispanicum]KAJ5594451.1 Endonuclease/exonuclease/phosphatase [Penicillium hispanicum]